jgi:hypothetical protein
LDYYTNYYMKGAGSRLDRGLGLPELHTVLKTAFLSPDRALARTDPVHPDAAAWPNELDR